MSSKKSSKKKVPHFYSRKEMAKYQASQIHDAITSMFLMDGHLGDSQAVADELEKWVKSTDIQDGSGKKVLRATKGIIKLIRKEAPENE